MMSGLVDSSVSADLKVIMSELNEKQAAIYEIEMVRITAFHMIIFFYFIRNSIIFSL